VDVRTSIEQLIQHTREIARGENMAVLKAGVIELGKSVQELNAALRTGHEPAAHRRSPLDGYKLECAARYGQPIRGEEIVDVEFTDGSRRP
jgi:hypothetical protein